MLLLCALLCLIIGWCLGGRLARFEDARLRCLPLPPVFLLCRALTGWFDAFFFAPYLLIASYLLLFVFLWLNRHLTLPALFLALGSLCNFLVIALNGCSMPVGQSALSLLSQEGAAALVSGEIPMYHLSHAATRLAFLGDNFWFPVPFFTGFASVGDMLLCVGIFFLVMALMAPPRLRWLHPGSPEPSSRK